MSSREAQAARLLVLACSVRKRSEPGLLPAIVRYDGPAFRLYRRYLRDGRNGSVRAYILSAEYGLIPESELIPSYNRRMTPTRALELRPAAAERLAAAQRQAGAGDLFFCLGRSYAAALPVTNAQRATGSLGAQLAQLHDWLWGHPPAQAVPTASRGPIRIRGVTLRVSGAHLLASAREWLDTDPAGSGGWHAWYVEVEGVRIAPKWLVSRAAGLPVGAFSTSDARRVLAQLGIEVHRA